MAGEAQRDELIVITGVEGGGVTLYGRRTDLGWQFRTSYADQTPLMLDEPEIRREGEWLSTWEEALEQLDRSRWLRLPAIRVHREFRAVIWDAICERTDQFPKSPHGQMLLERWKQRCAKA